jgi:alkylated DNA repair dioxygenase AlkB
MNEVKIEPQLEERWEAKKPYEMCFFKGFLPDLKPVFQEWNLPIDRVVKGQTIKGRPTRGFGDFEFEYTGKLMTPDPWDSHPDMPVIKEAVENKLTDWITNSNTSFAKDLLFRWKDKPNQLSECSFDFCLVGLYKTGLVHIPHHTDTVPSADSLVLSLSFGAPRLFIWRQYNFAIKNKLNTSEVVEDLYYNKKRCRTTKPYQMFYFYLEHGDAVLFTGKSQLFATHAVPKLNGLNEPRINLTFRSGLSQV